MLPYSLLVILLSLSDIFVLAASSSPRAGVDPRSATSSRRRSHAHALMRENLKLKKRTNGGSKSKRCVVKHSTSASALTGATPTDNTSKPSTTKTKTKTTTVTVTVEHSKTSTSAGPTPTPTSTPGSGDYLGPPGGIITVTDPQCGASGAQKTVTKTDGPNGKLDWLNCGVDKDGWKPPKLTLDDIVYIDFEKALKNKSSPFQACSKYLDLFRSVAANTTVNGTPLPPILLASFALQESSCTESQGGGGGEVGLFQLSPDKCQGGKSNKACFDPQYNTETAAKFIASQIEGSDGNVVRMVGLYNGWFDKMTIADATKAKNSSCCQCQNNLDYLQQFFNGWMLGIDAYALQLGKYFNLASCPNDGAFGRRRRNIAPRRKPEGLWKF
ncbi:hypothetical protein FRB99_000613 [Tulasnella sp. 403]|nr:hypothetical protein FRB99_000613 [Tulasnella sp. 403]